MTELPPARCLLFKAPTKPAYDVVVLPLADRAIRVRALTTVHDETFVVDLPERVSLDDCFGFELEDGRVIEIIHAEEALIEVRGDILRYCWHIGARMLPCQIEADRLLVYRNPEIEAVLLQLGARLAPVSEPFSPENPVHVHHHHAGASNARKHAIQPLPPILGDPF